jgi:hypothetical protein
MYAPMIYTAPCIMLLSIIIDAVVVLCTRAAALFSLQNLTSSITTPTLRGTLAEEYRIKLVVRILSFLTKNPTNLLYN